MVTSLWTAALRGRSHSLIFTRNVKPHSSRGQVAIAQAGKSLLLFAEKCLFSGLSVEVLDGNVRLLSQLEAVLSPLVVEVSDLVSLGQEIGDEGSHPKDKEGDWDHPERVDLAHPCSFNHIYLLVLACARGHRCGPTMEKRCSVVANLLPAARPHRGIVQQAIGLHERQTYAGLSLSHFVDIAKTDGAHTVVAPYLDEVVLPVTTFVSRSLGEEPFEGLDAALKFDWWSIEC